MRCPIPLAPRAPNSAPKRRPGDARFERSAGRCRRARKRVGSIDPRQLWLLVADKLKQERIADHVSTAGLRSVGHHNNAVAIAKREHVSFAIPADPNIVDMSAEIVGSDEAEIMNPQVGQHPAVPSLLDPNQQIRRRLRRCDIGTIPQHCHDLAPGPLDHSAIVRHLLNVDRLRTAMAHATGPLGHCLIGRRQPQCGCRCLKNSSLFEDCGTERRLAHSQLSPIPNLRPPPHAESVPPYGGRCDAEFVELLCAGFIEQP